MQYLSFFKLRFVTGLQYRFSAIAGLATQFFWGAMMIFLYEAFYKNGIDVPMKWSELVSYVWLGQAFYTLVFARVINNDVFESIKTGQISYELVRPLNIYWLWYIKISAQRLSACAIRFLPVIILAVLLPAQYSLKSPDSIPAFLLFITTLVLGLILTSALSMIVYIFMFYTTSCKGIFSIYGVIADFFSGMIIPIVFMPQAFQTLSYIFPFKLCMDLPMRLYVGNIGIDEGIKTMIMQIAWILILMIIGNFFMNRATKRVVVQGG